MAVFLSSLESWFYLGIEMLSHILNGYLTTFFVLTGVVLNIFSIYIFLRCERGGTPAIQYYLVTLTMWQTALLANAFLLYSLPHLVFGHLVSQGTYVHIYPYVYTFANTTHTGSVWIVLTLTIDRYLALCQPLKHRAIGKKSRVKRLMMIVSVLAVLFSLPRFFELWKHVSNRFFRKAVFAGETRAEFHQFFFPQILQIMDGPLIVPWPFMNNRDSDLHTCDSFGKPDFRLRSLFIEGIEPVHSNSLSFSRIFEGCISAVNRDQKFDEESMFTELFAAFKNQKRLCRIFRLGCWCWLHAEANLCFDGNYSMQANNKIKVAEPFPMIKNDDEWCPIRMGKSS